MYISNFWGDIKTSGVWKIHHLYQTKTEKKTQDFLVPTLPLELLRSPRYALLRLPGFQVGFSRDFLGILLAPKMVGFPNNHWFSMVKMISTWGGDWGENPPIKGNTHI